MLSATKLLAVAIAAASSGGTAAQAIEGRLGPLELGSSTFPGESVSASCFDSSGALNGTSVESSMLAAQQHCVDEALCGGILLNAGTQQWAYCTEPAVGGSVWIPLLPPATCIVGSGGPRTAYSVQNPDADTVAGLGTVTCAPNSQEWAGFPNPTVTCPGYPTGGTNSFIFEGCTENVCDADSGLVPNAVAANAAATGANDAGAMAYFVAGLASGTTPSEVGAVSCAAEYDGAALLACAPQPIDCVGSWGAWDACTATCGGGSQSRTFTITTASEPTGASCEDFDGATQSQSCGNDACAVDCVGSYGPWSDCNAACDNTGTRTRTYSVAAPQSGTGQTCPVPNGFEDLGLCEDLGGGGDAQTCAEFAFDLGNDSPLTSQSTFGSFPIPGEPNTEWGAPDIPLIWNGALPSWCQVALGTGQSGGVKLYKIVVPAGARVHFGVQPLDLWGDPVPNVDVYAPWNIAINVRYSGDQSEAGCPGTNDALNTVYPQYYDQTMAGWSPALLPFAVNDDCGLIGNSPSWTWDNTENEQQFAYLTVAGFSNYAWYSVQANEGFFHLHWHVQSGGAESPTVDFVWPPGSGSGRRRLSAESSALAPLGKGVAERVMQSAETVSIDGGVRRRMQYTDQYSTTQGQGYENFLGNSWVNLDSSQFFSLYDLSNFNADNPQSCVSEVPNSDYYYNAAEGSDHTQCVVNVSSAVLPTSNVAGCAGASCTEGFVGPEAIFYALVPAGMTIYIRHVSPSYTTYNYPTYYGAGYWRDSSYDPEDPMMNSLQHHQFSMAYEGLDAYQWHNGDPEGNGVEAARMFYYKFDSRYELSTFDVSIQWSITHPVECVGAWGEWGTECQTHVCNYALSPPQYSIKRQFLISVYESNGGASCSIPGLPVVENGDFEEAACSPAQLCPVDCVGSWSEWTDCPCGAGGTASNRTYTVTTAAADDGAECPAADGYTEVQSICPIKTCPVDCAGSWGDWSECSAVCGPGTRSRTFAVSTADIGNGTACEAVHGQIQTEDCTSNVFTAEYVADWCPTVSSFTGNADTYQPPVDASPTPFSTNFVYSGCDERVCTSYSGDRTNYVMVPEDLSLRSQLESLTCQNESVFSSSVVNTAEVVCTVGTNEFSFSGCTRCSNGSLAEPGMTPDANQTECLPCPPNTAGSWGTCHQCDGGWYYSYARSNHTSIYGMEPNENASECIEYQCAMGSGNRAGYVMEEPDATSTSGLLEVSCDVGYDGFPEVNCTGNGTDFLFSGCFAQAECAPVMIDASDKGFDDSYCHGPIGTVCEYNCSEGYTDEGTGSVVCQANLLFTETAGCVSGVAEAGEMIATAATAMVVGVVGATAGAAVAGSVAGGAGAGVAGGGAGGAGGGAAGDPVSLVFAVQFVAVSGSIAAPVGPAFRGFAGSFGWANGQMAPPSFMRTEAESNVTSSGGEERRRRRRLEAIVCAEDDEVCEEAKAEEEGKIRQKELKKAAGANPQDAFIGNLISLAVFLVGGWLIHTVLFLGVGAVTDGRRDKIVLMKAAIGDSLPEGLAVNTPDKFVVPPPLFYMKVAIILLCVGYMGVTQSSVNAMCDEGTDWYFFVIALLVFFLIPVGLPTYVYLVVRSMTGKPATGCGGLEGLFPKNSEITAKSVTMSLPKPEPVDGVKGVVFTTHLPRLEQAKKRAMARGGAESYDEAAVLELIELMKKELTPEQIANKGGWSGTTPQGAEQLAVYTPLFAKATGESIDMVPLFQCMKLLQVLCLSLFAPGCLSIISPLVQVLLLMAFIGIQIGFIVAYRPFLIVERDYIEAGVMVTQLLTFVAPALQVLHLISTGTSAGVMMGSAVAGVLLKLGKEMVSTVPTVKAMVVKFVTMVGWMPASDLDQVVARRDVTSILLEAEETNPALMHIAVAAVGDDVTDKIRELVAGKDSKLTAPFEELQKASISAAEDWRSGNGGVLIEKARKLQELDKVNPPKHKFRRAGMIAGAHAVIKVIEEVQMLKSDTAKIGWNEAVAAFSDKEDDLDIMFERFSSMCQEYLVGLLEGAMVIKMLESKVDAIRDAEKDRLGVVRDVRQKDAVKSGVAQQALADEEDSKVEDDNILLNNFPTKEELLEFATAITETFARQVAHEAVLNAFKFLDEALDEAVDIPRNEIPDDDDDLLAMLNNVKLVNPVHEETDVDGGMESFENPLNEEDEVFDADDGPGSATASEEASVFDAEDQPARSSSPGRSSHGRDSDGNDNNE